MNFYASVAMRAELFPYCLFFSGTCCCEDFYNQRLLCTKPNQNHLRLFSSLQVTGWRVLFRIWKSHFHVCLFSPVLLISIWWLPVFFSTSCLWSCGFTRFNDMLCLWNPDSTSNILLYYVILFRTTCSSELYLSYVVGAYLILYMSFCFAYPPLVS